MARALLLNRPRPLAFPGTAPGFDPAHPASSGIVGFGVSAISRGGNFVNILSGKAGTPSGAPTGVVDSALGPATALNAGSSQFVSLSQAANASFTQTIACILKVANTGTSQVFFQSGSAGNTGLAIYVDSSMVLNAYASSTNWTNGGSVTLVANDPYLVIVSVNMTAGVSNFLAVNLRTGIVQKSTGASSGVINTAGTTCFIGQDAFSNLTTGSIAAAMFSPAFLSLPQMQQWAADPWGFWYPRTLDLSMMLKTPAAGVAISGIGWFEPPDRDKAPTRIVPNWPPAYGRTPFVAANTNAGIPWSGPRDHVRLPIPTANISYSPAFVSTFKTAPISGMAWREPVDDIRIPPRVSYSTQPAIGGVPATVPISGMAWFEPRDKDYPPRVNFLTDPTANAFIPITVTWSFSVGDTTFLRDAPVDVPPGLGRAPFAAPVGISGIGWFEPPDRDRPATKVSVETPPAAFGRAIAPAAPISGMAWFTPLDWSKAKVSFDSPAAFQVRPPVGTPISGISWFEPPDRDKPANKVRIEAPPSIALTPATLPVPIRGMAWFEPPDRDRPATKFKLDNPPAWIYFIQSVITGTLVATESPDTVTITMTYRDLWVAATRETELWTPAIKQAETWTPE